MSSAREIALEVLPSFSANVLAGRVLSYGYYAKAIGRDVATESMVVGHAMHAIGGVCAIAGIPVAPLHFIKRADGKWRGIFESDAAESIHVLPHYNFLCLVARIYRYTENDFNLIERGLREILPKYLKPNQLSPHDIWHVAIFTKVEDSITFFQRSLNLYRQILD